MKILEIFFSSVVMCISSLPLILVILMLQREPSVPPNPPLDQARIDDVRQLLVDLDPRRPLVSEFQEVRLSEAELNALITYLRNNNRVLADVNLHVDLVTDGANVAASIPLRILGMHPLLNLTVHFGLQDDRLLLERVDAGALSLPPLLVTPLRQAIGSLLETDNNFALVSSFIDSLHFQAIDDDRIVILLDWQQQNLPPRDDEARNGLVSTREARRLASYHDRLAAVLDTVPAGAGRVGFHELARPLFLHAGLNSAGGGSAVAENRAVFTVLSAYLSNRDLSRLTGDDIALDSPRRLRVVIDSREDLAGQLAAMAAASAGSAMTQVSSAPRDADAARHRTGFDVAAIAADRAGTLLGTLATRSENDARLFQEQMKNSAGDADYLPPPDGHGDMSAQAFSDRYGNRESAAYREKLAQIDATITALPFYRAFTE